jgi:hypothetical protein
MRLSKFTDVGFNPFKRPACLLEAAPPHLHENPSSAALAHIVDWHGILTKDKRAPTPALCSAQLCVAARIGVSNLAHGEFLRRKVETGQSVNVERRQAGCSRWLEAGF